MYEYLFCTLACYPSSMFLSYGFCLSYAMITYLVGADVVAISNAPSEDE